MGLCKTSNFSIFTFIKDNDLKFCTRSYSSCVYHIMRFKCSNGKLYKMITSHFRTLLARRISTQIIFCCTQRALLHTLPLSFPHSKWRNSQPIVYNFVYRCAVLGIICCLGIQRSFHVFISSCGSSALLGRPRSGLSISLSLLAIFNTLF